MAPVCCLSLSVISLNLDSRKDDTEMKCTDPLLLDDLVLDNILEFVDDDTLLTGRLVCQRWKTEITQRNGLWRRRCERLGVLEPDKTFPPGTDFFPVYLKFSRLLRQMSRGQAWQVDDRCDGSHCLLHKEMASALQRQRHEDWILHIAPDIKFQHHFGTEIAICTADGELIVVDEEKQEVTWRTGKLATDTSQEYQGGIFTVTQTGNIEVYSLGGKCAATDTSGKLQGVREAHVHPTAPFILVWLDNDKVFLVNDEMQVFPLHLPSPQLPEQQDGQEPAEAEPIERLHFNIRVEHSGGQLVVAIERRASICFVVFTTSGDILHHLFLKCDLFNDWPVPLEPGQGRYRFVCVSEGRVVARSIQFSSRGITVEQLWKAALPARFAAWPGGTIAAGKKFLLAREGTALQVYRVDDGTLAADCPGFFRSFCMSKCAVMSSGPMDLTVQTIKAAEESTLWTVDAETPGRSYQTTYIVSYDWLDGLSPSTMRHDCPLAVTLTRENPRGRCLRWSEGLWADFPACTVTTER